MADTRETQVTVDLKAARVLERVRERAKAEGITLGDFLERAVPATAASDSIASKLAAIRAVHELAVERERRQGISPLLVDDSREGIYGDDGR